MADENKLAMVDNMKRLGLDPKWSDMIMVCDGREFHLHRNIVCKQSDVIKTALNGNFLESSNGRVEQKLYDLKSFECMIKFLYTEDYDLALEQLNDNEQNSDGSISVEHPVTDSLIAHANVHGLAEYYNIPKLKTKAVEKFKEVLKTKIPKNEEDKFVALLEVIYKQPKSQDAGLRPATILEVPHHIDYLLTDQHLIEDFKDKDALPECCSDIIARLSANVNAAADVLATKMAENTVKLQAREREIADLTYRRGVQQMKAAEAEESLEAITKLLEKLVECYRCGESINVSYGRAGKHGMGKHFIRCSCGAKNS